MSYCTSSSPHTVLGENSLKCESSWCLAQLTLPWLSGGGHGPDVTRATCSASRVLFCPWGLLALDISPEQRTFILSEVAVVFE